MVATYQPLSCCEDPSFQNMCFSLNQKVPIIGKDKLRTLLSEEYTITKNKLKMMFKGRYFSFTTDGWTSLANVGYVTCTAHFIDQASWKLHSVVMGLFEKSGGSTADNVVNYCESQLTLFDLSYDESVAVVTDTEATMIAAGQLLC
jgi:secreted trypsin-like serine protease